MPKTLKRQVHMGKLAAAGALAYTDCIACPDRGVVCNGPNLDVLDTDSYRSWVLLAMDHDDISHGDLSILSGVAKGTIDNFLAGTTADIRRDTCWRITRGLFRSLGDNPCPLKARSFETNAAAHADLKEHYETQLAELSARHERLRDQVTFRDSQISEKDALIREYMSFFRRKNRIIAILGGIAAVAIAVILVALIVDSMNPDIGFFWLK